MAKKDIVYKLNELFGNIDDISYFCGANDNNPDKVVKILNDIIKFAFIYKDFINEELTMGMILEEIDKIENLDELYRNYLEKTKGLFYKLSSPKKDFIYEILDDDIRIADVKGIILPSYSKIEEICNLNIERDTKLLKLEEKCAKAERFKEVGFCYIRPELFEISSSDTYIGYNLTGDIEEDLNILYSDDRYGNSDQFTNPLFKSYEANIEQIRKNKDMSIKKYGDLIRIENGRHRIVYLMSQNKKEAIPIKVIRRFEDREINLELIKLSKKFNANIYKNNLLNDEFDIIIEINNVAYNITSKEELIRLSKSLENGENIDIPSFEFETVDLEYLDKEEIVDRYTLIIYDLYVKRGKRIVEGNLTDIIDILNVAGDSLLEEAFNFIQYRYQYSKIYNDGFDNYFRSVVDKIKNENSKQEEVKIKR